MRIKLLVLTFFAALLPNTTLAHEGHDDAPGEESHGPASGPIEISADAKANIQVETIEAVVAPINKTISILGKVVPIPSLATIVTSRISGRVLSLFVFEGENVTKNQALLEIESRQVGDPPPRVTYRSPIDGVVIERKAVLGDAIEPDKRLFEIANLSEIYVEGRVFEAQISALKPSQLVRVSFEAYPDEIFEGSLELIGGALDEASHTLGVWARVKNPTMKLKPNMRAKLHVVTGTTEGAIAIPQRAILGDSVERFAIVESETNPLQYERRSVVTGIRDEQLVEIIQGIYPGDKVVTRGNYQLQFVSPKPAAKE